MLSQIKNSPETLPTVGKRLRTWRKSCSYKLVEFSKKIGVSQGSLSDLENDKSLPSATTLTNLIIHTDVDLVWLLTGKGAVVRKVSKEHEKSAAFEEFMLVTQDSKLRKLVETLIKTYREGDPKKIAHLEGFFVGSGL